MDLHVARGGDDEDEIDVGALGGFEQQRDVEHGSAACVAAGAREEGKLGVAHHGVDDGFKAAERVGLAQHRATQGSPVEPVVRHGAGEGRLDRLEGAAVGGLQAVHRGVGVEHRDAGALEKGGSGGFAHADAAGQSDDLHPYPSQARNSVGGCRSCSMELSHAIGFVQSYGEGRRFAA